MRNFVLSLYFIMSVGCTSDPASINDLQINVAKKEAETKLTVWQEASQIDSATEEVTVSSIAADSIDVVDAPKEVIPVAPPECPTNCDDGNWYTKDGCTNPIKGCEHTPAEPYNKPCTQDSNCPPMTIYSNCGYYYDTPVVSKLFYTGTCDVKFGFCGMAGNGGGETCSDGDACTVDTCSEDKTGCVNIPQDCDDGNACTTDLCYPTKGCVHIALNGYPCDDGNACTGPSDYCTEGTCGGPQVVCYDKDPCVTGSCSPAVGCTFKPIDVEAQCEETTLWWTGKACASNVMDGCTSANIEIAFTVAPTASQMKSLSVGYKMVTFLTYLGKKDGLWDYQATYSWKDGPEGGTVGTYLAYQVCPAFEASKDGDSREPVVFSTFECKQLSNGGLNCKDNTGAPTIPVITAVNQGDTIGGKYTAWTFDVTSVVNFPGNGYDIKPSEALRSQKVEDLCLELLNKKP